jgi:drug/metabolite transporter (DMT)-like permease
MTDAVSTWVTEKAGAIMGQMVVEGIEAFVPDQARQEELDLRLVPGVPSSLQFAYLISLVAGLIGWEHAFAWFARIWPPEAREEYRGAFGYHAARLVRLAALVLVFLPILGLPALVATMLTQLWRLLTAPIRWWRRLRGEAAHAERL